LNQQNDMSRVCQQVVEEIQDLWAEGHLENVESTSGSPPAEALRDHLAVCHACKQEVESLVSLERAMRAGFEEFDLSTPFPDSDEITRLLRQVTEEPTVSLLRRTRRSVRTVLWLCFLLLSLLGCSALLALAYRVLFQQ
jgi:hypothetical protein